MGPIRARGLSDGALEVAVKARTYKLLADWLDSEDEPVPPEQDARIEYTAGMPALDALLIQTAGEWDRLCGALVARARRTGRPGPDVCDLLENLDPLTVAAVFSALPPEAQASVLAERGYTRWLLEQAPADIPEALEVVEVFGRDVVPPLEIMAEVEASQTEYRKWKAGLPHDLAPEEVATAEQACVESRDLLAACARGETDMRGWFQEHHPGLPLPDDEEDDG